MLRDQVPALFDELEKIAISFDRIVERSIPAYNSGVVGHRRPANMGDPDTMSKITEMVRARGKRSWNPITKVKAHLAARKLDRAHLGTFEDHGSLGRAVQDETHMWARRRPEELASNLRDPTGSAAVNVFNNKPHRWEYYTDFQGRPFQRPGTVWQGRGVPHPTLENQRAAAAAAVRPTPVLRPSTVSTTTTLPTFRPPVTTAVTAPAAARVTSTLPAARRTLTSITPKIRPVLGAVA